MARVTRFCSSGILKWLKFSGVAPRTALCPASGAVSAVFAWPRHDFFDDREPPRHALHRAGHDPNLVDRLGAAAP